MMPEAIPTINLKQAKCVCEYEEKISAKTAEERKSQPKQLEI